MRSPAVSGSYSRLSRSPLAVEEYATAAGPPEDAGMRTETGAGNLTSAASSALSIRQRARPVVFGPDLDLQARQMRIDHGRLATLSHGRAHGKEHDSQEGRNDTQPGKCLSAAAPDIRTPC